MRSALLLGSYGQTNLGDDVLMLSYLQLLKSKGFDKIYVNASTDQHIPQAIEQQFPGLVVLPTYQTSLLQWIRILRQVDSVIYGGGTIYKELYASTGRSKHSVTARMVAFNALARLHGAKVYHLNIGIGSIKSALGRAIARMGLGTAQLSIFRDKKSYDFAKDTLQIPTDRIHQSTDGLFLDRRWQKPWLQLPLPAEAKNHKAIIGLNVLSDIPDWIDRTRYITAMRQLVNQLLADGYYLVLIPFQHAVNPTNDRTFIGDQIVPHIKSKKGWHQLLKVEVDEITDVLGQCDVVIGMRFHSLLLATAAHVPFLAITYDTKCDRYLHDTGYPHHIPLESLTASLAQGKLEDVLHDKANKNRLKKIAARQYNQGDECLQSLSF